MHKNLKICIVTQSHLCNNPRVLKEAITLSNAGYTVSVLNSIFSTALYQQDLALIKGLPISVEPVADLSASNYISLLDRSVKKLSGTLIKYLGIENGWALGYGAQRYIKACRSANADLYICHQELATYIGNKLISLGYKVAFDMEDWYSEDLLAEGRRTRPVKLLRNSESLALKNGVFITTTSNALANKLQQVYNGKLPEVIYNVFPVNTDLLKKEKPFTNPLKLFWFSQTIGPGRGIEQFIGILSSISNRLELHLLGNISATYQQQLVGLMPEQHPLYFHSAVDEKELAEKISGFDIGLALELNEPLSRNYTITNKFFQYIQSGLPVIASETEGQSEAFGKFKPGFKLSQRPEKTEIAALRQWLSDRVGLMAARAKAVEAAYFYNLENESKKLLKIVEASLATAS